MRSSRRSVDIAGDADSALVTLGDHSPVYVYRGGTEVFSLDPMEEPAPLPIDPAPALLLAARYELVDYIGREHVLEETDRWLGGDPVRAVRLVTGPGGQGKTRLAHEVARRAERSSWHVLWARHVDDGGMLSCGRDKLARPGPNDPVGALVIVDYADRWDHRDLLSLLRRPETQNSRLRILLLGRSDDFWSTLEDGLKRTDIQTSRRELEEIPSSSTLRQQMFDATVRAFSRVFPSRPGHYSGPSPSLSSEGFRLTLSIHISALVSVLRAHDGDRRSEVDLEDPAATSRELLAREHVHWTKLRKRQPNPVSLTPRVMARAVLVAVLTRGLTASEAKDVLRTCEIGSDPQTVVDDHGVAYPPTSDLVLEPLYPDRLAEDFVAALLPGAMPSMDAEPSLRFLADRSATVVLDELLAGHPRARASALTVLIEASARWPELAARYLAPVLRNRPDVAGTVPDPSIMRLAGLRPIPSELLDDVERLVERDGSHSRDMARLALLERIDSRRRAAPPGAAAHQLLTMATLRRRAGRLSDALAAVDESLERMAEAGSDLVTLADGLNMKGVILTDLERSDDALGVSRQVVNIRARITKEDERASIAYATSLHNLSVDLRDVGRTDEAFEAATLAIHTYELAPAGSCPADEYARTLDHYAGLLAARGLIDQALGAIDKAISIFDALSGEFQWKVDLARAQNDRGLILNSARRHEAAMDSFLASLANYREIAQINPSVYDDKVVTVLNNVAGALNAQGRELEAAPYIRESAVISERAVRADGTIGARLQAAAGEILADIGDRRFVEALEKADALEYEAREASRSGAPDRLSVLSVVLNNKAKVLASLGRPYEAIEMGEEAIAIRESLYARDRNEHWGDLVRSLSGQAVDLANVGDVGAAITCWERCFVLAEAEITDNPSTARTILAQTLTEAGRVLLDHDLERSLTYVHRALEWCGSEPDGHSGPLTHTAADAFTVEALGADKQGRPNVARKLASEALERYRRLPLGTSPGKIGSAFHNSALRYLRLDPERAIELEIEARDWAMPGVDHGEPFAMEIAVWASVNLSFLRQSVTGPATGRGDAYVAKRIARDLHAIDGERYERLYLHTMGRGAACDVRPDDFGDGPDSTKGQKSTRS